MKIVKYSLFVIIGIIVLIMIVALFLPKKIQVRGTTVIHKSAEEVYDYVKRLKTQENYSVWFEMDPDIRTIYSGEDGTIGAQIQWESDEVGNGQQIITGLEDGKKVEIDLYLMGDKNPGHYVYTITPVSDSQTQVVISLNAESPYPFNITQLFFNMNPYFQKTADQLKLVLEE